VVLEARYYSADFWALATGSTYILPFHRPLVCTEKVCTQLDQDVAGHGGVAPLSL
jgi:hypothetical protein